MIGFLRGLLVTKLPPTILLDVNGVGYEVDVPMTTFYNLPEIGQEARLFTHLVIREDAHTLFGFSGQADRALFRALIKVSGVGARLALTLLSGLSVDEFHRCVLDHDTSALVRLPGIGKKTAERLIIEMRDRLPDGDDSGLALASAKAPLVQKILAENEAVSALVALGYKAQEAQRMVKQVAGEGKSSEEIIRSALRSLG